MDLSNQARQAASDSAQLTGELTIAAVETVSTYRLPKILCLLNSLTPNIQIGFKVMPDQEIYESVKAGTIDIGFMVEEKLQIPNIKAFKLCNEPVSLYAHANHPLGKKSKLKIQDLANEHHLLWRLGCSYSDLFNELMLRAGFHSYSYTEFSNTETMKQCVLSGLGIATLTEVTVAKELMAGELIRLDFKLPDRFSSYMLWNKHRQKLPLIEYFIGLVRKNFLE